MRRSGEVGVIGLVLAAGLAMIAVVATVSEADRVSASEIETVLVDPLADTYVNSDRPTANYGRSRSLYVDGGPNQAVAYLRLDLPEASGRSLRSATLRMVTTGGTHAGSTGTISVRAALDRPWTETGSTRLTWDNRPETESIALGQLVGTDRNDSNEIALSPRILETMLGSATTLALTTSSGNGAFFWSSRAGDETLRPVVELVFTEPSADPLVVAAGDIACAGNEPTPTACQHEATSDVALSLDPDAVLALGDLQYVQGSLAEFQGEYDRTWGRLKSITHPTPGNHAYGTAGAAGYFQYFYENDGPLAGYYSFDLGEWHIVSLNSNCSEVSCAAGSEQEEWLRADLAASDAACTLAYWHHPWYSSGTRGPSLDVAPLAAALHENGVDVLLVAHNHFYERFAPLDPQWDSDPANGIREFVVGTGGKSVPVLGQGAYPHREVRDTSSFGVLALTLRPTSYDWEFVPAEGYTFTDVGSAPCH